MISLRSYLRFPSKSPLAWFVYSIFYIFLYVVMLFTQQKLLGNATSPQQMLQIQNVIHIATIIWYVLIFIPLIQIARNIDIALRTNKKLPAKTVGITTLFIVVLCIVALYVFLVLTPSTSENIAPSVQIP